MDARLQKIWLWALVVGMGGVFGVGWVALAGYIPPHAPNASAIEIAELYRNNATSIRSGLILAMFASTFMLPFVALLYVQLRRIERVNNAPPINSMIQVVGGTIALTVGVILPTMLWAAASFRPERSPELTQLLNDIAWIFFIAPFAPFATQNLAIAFGILGDRQPVPLFPRWLGWTNLWILFTALPAFLIFFFKTGPFAWNGIMAFWVPLILFFALLVVMIIYLFKAIGRADYETQMRPV